MTKMARMTITFGECEHAGDLENYKADLEDSGAKVLGSSANYAEENCSITVSISDYAPFLERFKETDAFGFSSLYD